MDGHSGFSLYQYGGLPCPHIFNRRHRPNDAVRAIRSDRDRQRLTGSSGPNNITFPGGNSRRPFLVELRDRENNNLEFGFMVSLTSPANAVHQGRELNVHSATVRSNDFVFLRYRPNIHRHNDPRFGSAFETAWFSGDENERWPEGVFVGERVLA